MSEVCCVTLGGIHCDAPASHRWGPLGYCCNHFDELVATMLDIRAALENQRHEDFVREHKNNMARGRQNLAEENKRHADIVKQYEEITGRPSRIPGTDCKAKEP